MTGNTPWKAQDLAEPIQADTIGAIANIAQFNTISGCAATYSISDMIVTIAAGAETHTGTVTAVAGNTVTLVSDPSSPRFSYIYLNSSGVAAIVSGTPSATPSVPDFGVNVTNQLVYVQAGLTIAGSATYRLDKRVMAPNASALGGLVNKYKSAGLGAQTISASTTFVDVSSVSSGTFSFTPGASEVWLVEILLNVTFTSTGGLKLQFTGPASPTRVDINCELPLQTTDSGGSSSFVLPKWPLTPEASLGTAFSVAFAAHSAAATTGVNSLYDSGAPTNGSNSWPIRVTALIANGATSSAVTLQAAQNSANGTAVIGIGSWMTARRIA